MSDIRSLELGMQMGNNAFSPLVDYTFKKKLMERELELKRQDPAYQLGLLKTQSEIQNIPIEKDLQAKKMASEMASKFIEPLKERAPVEATQLYESKFREYYNQFAPKNTQEDISRINAETMFENARKWEYGKKRISDIQSELQNAMRSGDVQKIETLSDEQEGIISSMNFAKGIQNSLGENPFMKEGLSFTPKGKVKSTVKSDGTVSYTTDNFEDAAMIAEMQRAKQETIPSVLPEGSSLEDPMTRATQKISESDAFERQIKERKLQDEMMRYEMDKGRYGIEQQRYGLEREKFDLDKEKTLQDMLLKKIEAGGSGKLSKMTESEKSFLVNADQVLKNLDILQAAVQRSGTYEYSGVGARLQKFATGDFSKKEADKSISDAATISSLNYENAVAIAKMLDPSSVAREGEVAAAKKYMISTGMTASTDVALQQINQLRERMTDRLKTFQKITGSEGLQVPFNKEEENVPRGTSEEKPKSDQSKNESFVSGQARITAYNPYEDEYGSQTAKPNSITGKNRAIEGVTVAVDPDTIPYGSKIDLKIPQAAKDLLGIENGQLFEAHDTGSAVKKQVASGGKMPVIDIFVSDPEKMKQLTRIIGDKPINYDIVELPKEYAEFRSEYLKKKDRTVSESVKAAINTAEEAIGATLGEIVGGAKELGKRSVTSPLETLARTPSTAAGSVARNIEGYVNLASMIGRAGLDKLKDIVTDPSEEQQILSAYKRRKFAKFLAKTASGDESAVAGEIPEISKGAQFLTDPLFIAGGIGGRIGKTALEKAALSGAAKVVGGAEKVAEVGRKTLELPARGIEAIGEQMQGTQLAKIGQLAPPVIASVPAAAAGAAGTVEGALKLTKEALIKGTKESQVPIFRQIANDTTKSPLLRRTANLLDKAKVEPVLKTSADFGKGALVGGTLGGGFAIATGGDAEEIGAGIGSGGVYGGLGYIGGRLSSKGERFKAAQDADRNAYIERHKTDSRFKDVDISKVPKDFLQKATDMELYGGGKFEIRLADDATYKALGGETGRGFILSGGDGVDQIIINTSKLKSGDTIAHEVGHAIYNSTNVDKTPIRTMFEMVYGEEGIAQRQQEYAAKILAEERGVKSESLLPEEVNQKINQLNETAGRDWVYSELFSEHFRDQNATKGYSELVGRSPLGRTILESFTSKWLGATKNFLEELGIKFKQDGSGQIDSKVFSQNPLSNDPKIRRVVGEYQSRYGRFLDGLSKSRVDKDVTAIVTKEQLLKDKRFSLKEGESQNDIFRRNESGTVVLKDPKIIKAEERARLILGENLYQQFQNKKPSADYSTLAKRIDGRVNGRSISEHLEGRPEFSDTHRRDVKILEEAIKNGETVESFYRKAIDKKGNVEVGFYEMLPYSFDVTSKGNIIARTIRMDAFRRNVLNLQNAGKLDELFDGNANRLFDDMKKMVENHREGKRGSDGIGDQQYQFIRKMLNWTENKDKTLSGENNGKFWRSMRIDRFTDPRRTGDLSYGFDQSKIRKNLMPNE